MMTDIIKCKVENKWFMANISLSINPEDNSGTMKIMKIDQIEKPEETTVKKIKGIFAYVPGVDAIDNRKYSSLIKKLQEKIIKKYKLTRLTYF